MAMSSEQFCMKLNAHSCVTCLVSTAKFTFADNAGKRKPTEDFLKSSKELVTQPPSCFQRIVSVLQTVLCPP